MEANYVDPFQANEDNNGYRLAWNALPTNRLDNVTISVPISCTYTPLKQINNPQLLEYQPVMCSNTQCGGILNPFCQVNYENHNWVCPICNKLQTLPPGYNEMTAEHRAAELLEQNTTIEYLLDKPAQPLIYLFVVDTLNTEKEHAALKENLLRAIQMLPPFASIGLISFGTVVYIHELKFSECPRCYSFNGQKTYTVDSMKEFLHINQGNVANNPFIVQASEADQMLLQIIDQLAIDPFPVQRGYRAARCTGVAMHIGVTLLQALFPTTGSQLVVFTSGPITRGPGLIAPPKRTDMVRQHADIEKGKSQLSIEACKFFNEMGKTAVKQNIVINYVCASFEETGLFEVEKAIFPTGGFIIACETWQESIITPSLIKYFQGGILANSGADAAISVHTSSTLKTCGCIGPCAVDPNKSNPSASSERIIGIGETTHWRTSGLLPSTTFSFYFEVPNSHATPVPIDTRAIIQFKTTYRHMGTGLTRIRATTISLPFCDYSTQKSQLSQSFDQSAASVILARYAIWKARLAEVDAMSVIDKTLIHFCRAFAQYTKGQPDTFQCLPSFNLLPLFMYHLRRSPFVQTFNSSPDLTCSMRHQLLIEEVDNSLYLIQPVLLLYRLDQEPIPVPLDMSALQEQVVLLLDTYFRVLVWHGSTIAEWRDQNYQDKEEFVNVKHILEDPVLQAQELLNDRFPTPSYVSCDQNSSGERYLLTTCCPEQDLARVDSHGVAVDNPLGTDEPTYKVFSEKLAKMSVTD